jgi:hypothetical protein
MSEPEKEEPSKGFEADVWLAMVLLSGSIWMLYLDALGLALCTQTGDAASASARRLDVDFQAKAHAQCR